ncbi:M20 family metallo-hydrolase [Anaerobacillus sp. MEB173]|uniref:M20 family metallo-hydrolase n=1 Tax=Anaerobacillus sp. MEB173 TaxID=3383345 RepID=UPI003F931979
MKTILDQLTINKNRLSQNIEQLAEIGKIGETGVCRPTLSTVEKKAFELVSKWMEDAGMTTRLDNCGNLFGRIEGKDPDAPVLMIGSHLDSQPNGGRFDGTAGVLSGIEAVATMTEKGIVPDRPIEVVSFCDEEGWRFNKGLFGSRGIIGKLDEGELGRVDKDGVTREQALREFGCNPDKLSDSVYPPGSIHSFLELHIEQGPLLEKVDQPVGIVTGIAGPLWLTVKVKGFAGHAGTVPMYMRQDALVGASEMILSFNELVKRDSAATTVGTVGALNVSPASRNVIPEEVEFTIDLRDIDLDRRNMCEYDLRENFKQIAEKHNVTVEIIEDQNSEPSFCAGWIKDIIRSECQHLGLDAPNLMSGAFHDSLMLSNVCDYGMIFVRCKEGISHNPAEFASNEDLAIGADVLYRTVLKMMK